MSTKRNVATSCLTREYKIAHSRIKKDHLTDKQIKGFAVNNAVNNRKIDKPTTANTAYKPPLFDCNVHRPLQKFKTWLGLSLTLSVVVLSGCTDRVMLASDRMAEIRDSSSQPVEPVPEPNLVEDYVYDASELRSPFMPPSLLSKQQVIDSTTGIAPDNTREKEALEAFELSQLVYRGRVISPEGVEFGLIQRPDGVVDSVKVGDYMGMNHGRIVEITATQINLIEIVPDNRAGYLEKPASVVSPI